MLKIKNIQRIIGLHANGRYIKDSGEYQKGDEYFKFIVESERSGMKYDREHLIVLSKYRNVNGKYYMFNMGLQLVTEVEVHDVELKTASDLAVAIRRVLVKTQTYYQTN